MHIAASLMTVMARPSCTTVRLFGASHCHVLPLRPACTVVVRSPRGGVGGPSLGDRPPGGGGGPLPWGGEQQGGGVMICLKNCLHIATYAYQDVHVWSALVTCLRPPLWVASISFFFW